MVNIGIDPACDLEGKVFVVDSDLSAPPKWTIDFSMGNDLANQIPAPWGNDTVTLGREAPAFYVVMAIKYWDRRHTQHDQDFFTRWEGVREGNVLGFRHATKEQREQLRKHLCEELEAFHEN